MKNRRGLTLALVVSMLLSMITVATAASKMTLIVNGVVASVEPKVISGTTYVPVRAAAELLGARVEYIASAKAVVITSGDEQREPSAVENSSTLKLYVNGSVTEAKPKIISGTTYVPVRAAAELLGAKVNYDSKTFTVTITSGDVTYDVTISFPVDRYPETAAHIKVAMDKGESAICTIDRDGADANREESLAGIPTKEGYDRDEWPMAMCEEGGTGADVAYVPSSDNRGAGAWVGNQLEDYKDGTKVLFVISGNVKETTPIKPTNPTPSPSEESNVTYANCAAVREAGKAPLYKGDPGYSTKLDRDGDGVACEAS